MYSRSVRLAANPARVYVCLSCISRGTAPSPLPLGHVRRLTQDAASLEIGGSRDGIENVIHGNSKPKRAISKKKKFNPKSTSSKSPDLAQKKKKTPDGSSKASTSGPTHKKHKRPDIKDIQSSIPEVFGIPTCCSRLFYCCQLTYDFSCLL